MSQSPVILRFFLVFLTPSRKMPKKFLKLVHDRPFPHLFPNLNCQSVSVRPFALPADFTFHFAFSISLFIFHCLRRVLHHQSAQEHMDGRTDTKLWLTFTSQNNALDNKLPRTRVSNPRPMVQCVNYVSTHYKNGTTIKAVGYTIYASASR